MESAAPNRSSYADGGASMTASTLNIFFPEEHRTAELLDRFEQLVRSNADQTRIDENHDAIIKLIGSICGRIEPSQPRRCDRTQPGSPEIGSLGWRSNIKCLRPTVLLAIRGRPRRRVIITARA